MSAKRAEGTEPPRARSHRRPRRRERGPEIAGLKGVTETTIYPHVFSSADREVGGVLVGRMSADGGLPLVTGAIAAISADEQKATLTFTQEAWAHVHHVLETQFPSDEQIIGWYHSHPGFGIFLSGHDLFIQENFFDAPSQIAVVVDPIGCREGAFGWTDGKVVPLFEQATPRRWKAPEELTSKPVLHAHDEASVMGAASVHQPTTRLLTMVALVTCVLVLIASLLVTGVFGGSSNSKRVTRHDSQGSAHHRHTTSVRRQP